MSAPTPHDCAETVLAQLPMDVREAHRGASTRPRSASIQGGDGDAHRAATAQPALPAGLRYGSATDAVPQMARNQSATAAGRSLATGRTDFRDILIHYRCQDLSSKPSSSQGPTSVEITPRTRCRLKPVCSTIFFPSRDHSTARYSLYPGVATWPVHRSHHPPHRDVRRCR